MNRRNTVLALFALGVAPLTAEPQHRPDKIYRIGCIFLRDRPGNEDEAFRQALRELGYVEGRNLTIEYRWAAGIAERLPVMATELVRLKVDVIVGAATPTIEAAKRATSTIPIVMAVVSDPVDTGLVSNLARPEGNVTGLTLMTAELSGKRLQLMRELIPKATHIAVLTPTTAVPASVFLKQMRYAAQQLGITVLVQFANTPEELPVAFTAMQRSRAQGLIVPISPFISNNITRILELAAQHRLPTMYETQRFVDAGGLVAYGPNTVEMYRRAAFYVDRIFKGAKPADLPIEQPTKFELAFNKKTAETLGITIPQSMLARADRVIE